MAKKGVALQGVQIHFTDLSKVRLTDIQFWFLQEARKLDASFDPFEGREDRYRMFDRVLGSDNLRTSLLEDYNFEAIRESWTSDEKSFVQKSSKYYLYK